MQPKGPSHVFSHWYGKGIDETLKAVKKLKILNFARIPAVFLPHLHDFNDIYYRHSHLVVQPQLSFPATAPPLKTDLKH